LNIRGNSWLKTMWIKKTLANGGQAMSKFYLTRTMVVYVGIFFLGILIAPVFSGLIPAAFLAGDQAALAQSGSPESIPADLLDPDAPNISIYTCTPDFVGELSNRVHVHCTIAAPGGVYWFATPTSDSKRAARIFSLMLTAAAAAKNVRVYYDDAASGASYGCSISDCRPILFIELIK
jgi:hypothetical protein